MIATQVRHRACRRAGQLNGDCSIPPRFHFRCRARPRSQIVPNGRLQLNAFHEGAGTAHDASVQMIDTSIVRLRK
jgi:hypothetical protein